jgi:hypothetical protein
MIAGGPCPKCGSVTWCDCDIEITRLADDLESIKIKYADCARLLEDAEGQVDLYKKRIQQLYASHDRKDVEIEAWRGGRLEYELTVNLLREDVTVGGLCLDGVAYDTIAAAVDALMAREGGEMMTKELMIQQGYVPPTCTLPEQIAGPMIWHEINAGRDVCAGCDMDRSECHGRPNSGAGYASDLQKIHAEEVTP